MAPLTSRNPFLFTPLSVTLVSTIVYVGIAIALLLIHETVPPAPTNPVPYKGVNTTEAWLDLTELSNGFHPYNSKRNDEVRDWLLRRIEEILDDNGVGFTTESEASRKVVNIQPTRDEGVHNSARAEGSRDDQENQHDRTTKTKGTNAAAVTIFNDLVSNVTCSAGRQSVYFEG